MTKECEILHDVMSAAGEICILMKFSPKREHFLGNMSGNMGKENSETFTKLKKLSATRWKVCTECIKRIIDNNESLLQLWEECLKEKLDQETKAKIVGYKNQMESFYFVFGSGLSYKLYAMTDDLSKSLQSRKMPAIKGKKCADLVIDTMRSMRNDEDFDSFFEVVKKAANPVKPVGKPTLPRKRKKPNYSILQYVIAHDYFKPMYFQALDVAISVISDRFEQPALKKFRNIEELLLKAINKADSSKEWKVLLKDFRGDFDRNQLESELHLIPAIFRQSIPVNFRNIC